MYKKLSQQGFDPVRWCHVMATSVIMCHICNQK